MTNTEFEQAYGQYASDIQAIARRLAKTDDDLCDDLNAVGMIALWQLELAPVTTNERAYVRQAVRNRMIDHLRRQRTHKTESLDARIEAGDQVVEDGEFGHIHRRKPRQTVRDLEEPNDQYLRWSNDDD